MPKNKVSDLITDQEIAFAHLVLSGTMTDQRAAEAVGLDPSTAAYIKSKPSVRAYMLEHRARMQQQVQQQHLAQEIQGLRRQSLDREQVLGRLWEIANLSPEMTRNSVTGQVKALSLIIAIEGLIPDRRAGSAEKKPAPPPNPPQIYQAAWLGSQQQQTTGPENNPIEEGPGIPPVEPAAGAPPNPGREPGLHPDLDPSLNPGHPVDRAAFAPDIRVPYSIQKNRFGRRR